MKKRISVIAVAFACITIAGPEWQQFRGRDGNGVSDASGLPTTWSSKENIVWQTKLPGPGTSCPIQVGKRVYLTCYSGYGLEQGEGDMDKLMRHVVCVDRKNGKILWTKDFKPALPESRYQGRNNSQHGYASATPASDGKHLYIFFGKSGLYCLDLDGNEIWRADAGDNATGWGSSNSPVLYNDLVIVNASVESRSLVAFNKNNGKEKWRVENIRSSWCTPVLVDVPGKEPELVINDSAAVIGFEPATGKELWRVPGFRGYVCPSVVSHNGIVYVVRGEALAIRAGGRGDVTNSHVLWRTRGRSRVSSPVYHDGLVYWDGTNCVDAKTGEEVYRKRLSNGGQFYASPIVADGKIYYTTRFRGTYVIAAGREFKELALNQFEDDPSRTNASPVVSDGCILLRTDRNLYCIAKQ